MKHQREKRLKLPRGWAWARLDDVCEVVLGQSPPSSTYNEEGIGLPFYQGKMEFGEIYPKPRQYCSVPKKIAKKGAILLSVRAPVGPTNLCPDTSCIGRGLAALHPLEGVDSRLLLYFLRYIEGEIAAMGTGTTFEAIRGSMIRSIDLPIPPTNEQYRIVAKIEELLTGLNSASASLRKVQVQLKRYREAVLKNAVEGRLTAQWREKHKGQIEPAERLLKRIFAERRAKWEDQERARMRDRGVVPENDSWKKKYQAPSEPDMNGLPELPEGWAWSRLDTVADLKGGITKDAKRKLPDSREVLYLRVANVQRGYLDLSEMKFISAPESVIDQIRLKRGDILFTEGGDRDKLGRGWVWQEEISECIHQNHVVVSQIKLTIFC